MDFRFQISDFGWGKRFARGAVRGWALLLWLAVVVGCGTGDGPGSPSDELSKFVSGVADAAGTAEAFKTVFAEGAAPPESKRAEYGRYAFWAKDVSLSGDSATITVEVSGSDDQVIAEVQWTAKRQGTQWKLETAPLP